MTEPVTRLEVDRAIAAEPAAIFDILRSPEGHVAIDASGMLMSAEGELLRCHALPDNEKVEGIDARWRRGMVDVSMVTDADDPRIASRLLRARFAM